MCADLVIAPVTKADLAVAAAEAHEAALAVRRRLEDEDAQQIRALELETLSRAELLEQLTALIAEMDFIANPDDPDAGTIAEWSPEVRGMFGHLTKPDLVAAIVEHEVMVEPAIAARRRLLEALAVRLAVDPRGTGPVFRQHSGLDELPAIERDELIDRVAAILRRWWETPQGQTAQRRIHEQISSPRWF